MDGPWEFALTCVIHIIAFDIKLAATGQHIITVDAFFQMLFKVKSLSLFLSL